MGRCKVTANARFSMAPDWEGDAPAEPRSEWRAHLWLRLGRSLALPHHAHLEETVRPVWLASTIVRDGPAVVSWIDLTTTRTLSQRSMLDLDVIRAQFTALRRRQGAHPVAYFDGPAGSQVPRSVAEAVSSYLLTSNANRGAPFATSQQTDAIFQQAARAAADLVGAGDPHEIVFGPNMTSLTYTFSRALSADWSSRDEVIVTRLDHDANVSPWVQAAARTGARVHHVDIDLDDCTLDLQQFESLLSERTRLIAVGYASNATGTINPVQRICRAARDVGAVSYVDAVHYAPHGLIDVGEIGCDFLVCSAYKFFGPHVGLLWGRRDMLESLQPAKLRPSPNTVPERWMTGTQNHEGIAGVIAAIDYLASLAGEDADGVGDRRSRLAAAFAQIRSHETALAQQLLSGLADLPGLRIWGITNEVRFDERVPTVSITHQRRSPPEMATALAEQGLWTWPGNHYALSFSETAGLEPDGTLRIGLLHYNTSAEVDRLLQTLSRLLE
jgi:cysteine desulfurase family protein (TIGR01976 family)